MARSGNFDWAWAAGWAVMARAAAATRSTPDDDVSPVASPSSSDGATAGAEGDYWPKVVASFNAKGGRTKVTFEAWPPDQNNVPASITLAVSGGN